MLKLKFLDRPFIGPVSVGILGRTPLQNIHSYITDFLVGYPELMFKTRMHNSYSMARHTAANELIVESRDYLHKRPFICKLASTLAYCRQFPAIEWPTSQPLSAGQLVFQLAEQTALSRFNHQPENGTFVAVSARPSMSAARAVSLGST